MRSEEIKLSKLSYLQIIKLSYWKHRMSGLRLRECERTEDTINLTSTHQNDVKLITLP